MLVFKYQTECKEHNTDKSLETFVDNLIVKLLEQHLKPRRTRLELSHPLEQRSGIIHCRRLPEAEIAGTEKDGRSKTLVIKESEVERKGTEADSEMTENTNKTEETMEQWEAEKDAKRD
jgi:hypothetical protein